MIRGGSDIPARPEPISRAEHLTAAFYEWERRGRGWYVWDNPVELEPPFSRFVAAREQHPPRDDLRHETIRSSIARQVRDVLGFPSAERENTWEEDQVEDERPPLLSFPKQLPVELQLSIPFTERTMREAAERLLLSLPYGTGPLAFEIVGTAESTAVQFACRRDDQAELRSQLRSFYPQSVITDGDSHFIRKWRHIKEGYSLVVDFGLSSEFVLPIRTFKGYDVDPLISAVGAMDIIRDGEIGIVQVLFKSVRHDWPPAIMQAIRGIDGKAFFADAPELLKLALQKVEHPLFAVILRVGARAGTADRAQDIVRAVGGFVRQFSAPMRNEFIPLLNDAYDDEEHEVNLLVRATSRSGMLLNVDELVGLVHLPSASVRSTKLVRTARRTRAAPVIVEGHDLVLGDNSHADSARRVTLSAEQRTRHTHIVGASGTGKSHLLLNLIIQDIKAGRGVGVLDPHGDLVDRLLSYIPRGRREDVILFDPADEEYPVGFNILSAHSTLEKQLISSDLVSVFQRLSTSWGDQMTSVLGNAILAFLESPKGGTLAELRRFLVEKEFRRSYLSSVADPEVVYFWEKEFPLLSGRPQAPLLTRLDTFLRPRLVRNIVAQKENRIDVGRIMNGGKIFLGKLSQGAIGEENAHLLGTLLVSKFYQIALSRQELKEEKRRPFFLYIDEFHHFVTPTLATILSGARKYRLGLTLAHQDMRQLQSRNPELASAVLTNPYTRICFRVGDADAQKLASGFANFESPDLQNLGRGEAICRVERNEYDFNLETLALPPASSELGYAHPDDVTTYSRETYGIPREEVEGALRRARPDASESIVRNKHDNEIPRKPVLAKAPEDEARTLRSVEDDQQAPSSKTVAGRQSSVGATLGRGGRQHKYLQELIKRWADANGWRATIEKPILDGLGSVDVALEDDLASVACEITITSTPDHELQNVQKCLAAGFSDVAVISADEKVLKRARNYIAEKVEDKDKRRVHFLTPEDLFAFLSTRSAPAAEEFVGGYKVAVKLRSDGEEEERTRREAISHVILDAMRRMSNGKG